MVQNLCINYLTKPQLKEAEQAKNTKPIIQVIIFKPFSSLLLVLNICAELPILPMPSPFAECIKIKTTSKKAEMICKL